MPDLDIAGIVLAAGADEHPVPASDATALVVSVATWERLKAAAGRANDLELFHEGASGGS